jgi:DNA-binding NtrC family response regulator
LSLILIVDDEAGIREVLARWLVAAGHEVREAESAEAALGSMARQCADVVMCDIEMPGQGGVWMADQLRERYPTTAMVLATALDSIPAKTSFKPGIVEYLVKPFERESVVAAVTASIRWHTAAVEQALNPSAPRGSVAAWLDEAAEIDALPPAKTGD